MKTLYFTLCWLMLIVVFGYSQKAKQLPKNQITSGKIVYFELAKDSSEQISRYNYFLNAKKIILKNITEDAELNIKGVITKDENTKLIFIKFIDETLKEMADDDFELLVDSIVIAKTSIDSSKFNIDLKPAFDATTPQKIDIDWLHKYVNNNIYLRAKGNFSTKPDSSALNNVQFNAGWSTFIITQAGVFKYVALNGQISSEHPQNFSQTNMVGSAVLSTVLPWTDMLARVITNNRKKNSSI
ncbi:MAG: hypothetical protein Q8N83_09260, partial [Ignavibacteria bacterium]|nr:hypothetical protein [Ignavibacteria bacterium]